MERKEILLGKSPAELQQLCAELGFPKFAAKQIALWLYGKKARSIEAMTDLSAKNRLLLAEHAEIGCAEPLSDQSSQDGTRKFLFTT
ncbi:MAG: 23S rRNA (adenine(2503)-C(2))-methyltransferase RlmN, partial [Bacteroidales bacterium]|nr:23S rRNA (adenine(2503)-C(2))-methyltransferase RlmN [Bacteroidales bacterium]